MKKLTSIIAHMLVFWLISIGVVLAFHEFLKFIGVQ